MIGIIRAISPIQILFIPAFIGLTLFLLYRVLWKQDKPAGLVLYLGLVIIVDTYMVQGLFIPGLEKGSIKYSEVLWLILFIQDKKLRSYLQGTLRKRILTFFIIYFLFLLIAAFKAINIKTGIFFFRGLVFPQFLAFLIAITGFSKEEDYVRFYKYFILLIIITALYIIWLQFNNVTIIRSPTMYSYQFARNVSYGRHGSFFGNPNYLAIFILLLLPVYIMLLVKEKRWKYFYFFSILVLLYMFSQTGSRSPLICMVAVLFILFILKLKIMFKLIPFVLAMALVFLIAMPGVVDTVTRRLHSGALDEALDTEREDSTMNRGIIWQISLVLINKNPLGIGLGEDTFQRTVRQYINMHDYVVERNFILDNPHNSYLEIAASSGLQAIAIFLLLLGLFFKSTLRVIRAEDREIFTGMVVGVLGFAGAMIAEPIMFKPSVANLFWIQMGLCISMIERYRMLKNPDFAGTKTLHYGPKQITTG